jgi:hypothetical protein
MSRPLRKTAKAIIDDCLGKGTTRRPANAVHLPWASLPITAGDGCIFRAVRHDLVFTRRRWKGPYRALFLAKTPRRKGVAWASPPAGPPAEVPEVRRAGVPRGTRGGHLAHVRPITGPADGGMPPQFLRSHALRSLRLCERSSYADQRCVALIFRASLNH